MVSIQWSNGSTTSARTWDDLTAKVAAIQWHEYTPEQMRHVLAKRAWRWSNVDVDPDAASREFWHGLETAKLVIIEKDDDEGSTT